MRRSNRGLQALSNRNQILLRTTDEQSPLEDVCRIVCVDASYHMA